MHKASQVALAHGWKLDAEDASTLEQMLGADLGARLMELWKMPALIIEAIGGQKMAGTASEEVDITDFARITCMAVEFATRSLTQGENEINDETPELLSVTAGLNLYPEDVNNLLQKQEMILIASESLSS